MNEAVIWSAVQYRWPGRKELGADMSKVDVNGGACAIGHPLGASGCRLLTTLVHEMEKRDARYGLSTMCIGFGQATATILERV